MKTRHRSDDASDQPVHKQRPSSGKTELRRRPATQSRPAGEKVGEDLGGMLFVGLCPAKRHA